MNLLALLLVPSMSAILILPMIPNRMTASRWSAIFSLLNFLTSIPLIMQSYHSLTPIFFLENALSCDKLEALFLGLNTLIATTISFYTISYLNNESPAHLHRIVYRFYHVLFHLFTFSMLMVILSNNIGLTWIAMESATISSVLLIALHQKPESLEAAWKYIILCGVGIGFALVGTVILYFAAYPCLPNEHGLLWTALVDHAPHLSPKLLAIAFVFLFIGYGTKVGLFPLHNWLPDAHAESPAPVSALLSGLLLNTALLTIVRFQLILTQTSIANFTKNLLLLFGFGSLLFAALSLVRQQKLKRILAYSSIEHMGLISIAFGLGTSMSYLAGLLHILMHSLSKTAAFLSVGTIIQRFHTQNVHRLKGLTTTTPINAWCLLLSMFFILGLPPSGLFFSEIYLILSMAQTHAGLLVPLITGLSIAFLAMFSKIQGILIPSKPTQAKPIKDTRFLFWPVALHLVLVIISGLWIPMFLIQPVIQYLLQGR